MKNNNLNCDATNCAYNTSGCCYAGSIKVDGMQATTTGNTYCASFEDKYTSGITSRSNDTNQVDTDNIHCEAVKCKYNKNELCKAEKVHINSGNASCETFEMK
nr:DUF1540 domain-containing protein [Clostridioides difficile]